VNALNASRACPCEAAPAHRLILGRACDPRKRMRAIPGMVPSVIQSAASFCTRGRETSHAGCVRSQEQAFTGQRFGQNSVYNEA
jgi:hypothetical protein